MESNGDGEASHKSHQNQQHQEIVDSSDIRTEIVESVDDYASPSVLFPSSSSTTTRTTRALSEDECSLRPGDLMPMVRSRSPAADKALHQIEAEMLFNQQRQTASSNAAAYRREQNSLITSAHTPGANLILSLGGKLRSLVSRREQTYMYRDEPASDHSNNFQLLHAKRNSASTDNFSPIADEMAAYTYEVYDGTQEPIDIAGVINNRPSAMRRSPSLGPSGSSKTQQSNAKPVKRQLRFRSSEPQRGHNRQAMYEER